ncbi:MAG: hypothetical protein MUF58_10455 [Arcicella sp.]|jgi:hypothetical protein|nr:hypothetical protein [Arcicella sp.]
MNAIREYVDVQQGNIVQFQLPDDFKATRVEVIVLPFENISNDDKSDKKTGLSRLRGIMKKQPIEVIEKEINDLRNEWERNIS